MRIRTHKLSEIKILQRILQKVPKTKLLMFNILVEMLPCSALQFGICLVSRPESSACIHHKVLFTDFSNENDDVPKHMHKEP